MYVFVQWWMHTEFRSGAVSKQLSPWWVGSSPDECPRVAGLKGRQARGLATLRCISQRINNIAKQDISINNSDRKMQSRSLGGGVGGEYNDVGLVEIG